jgi:hypothetical protein
VLIGFFSLLLGLLIYWLLGFVVNDIGQWPGPDYTAVERERVDPTLLAESESLLNEIADTTRLIGEEKARQTVLRDSTDNSARTMNQLLEVQRMNLQRSVPSSDTEQQTLREAQQLFVANQQAYQQANERVSSLSERLRTLESGKRGNDRRLEELRMPARAEYQRLFTRHQLKVAAVKLAVLVPLLGIAVGLFLKRRAGLYAPVIHALGVATLVKVLLVMHEHFPRRYFKYVLIVAALVLVGRILVFLIRSAAFPRREWLLRQYREAYERFFCPCCGFPIRRGPLRYAFWTRRSLPKVSASVGVGSPLEADTPYVCPACSTRLFEECPSCGAVRHSLLPACMRCGVEKPLGEG